MSDNTPEPGEIADLSLGLSDADARSMIDAPEIDIDEAFGWLDRLNIKSR